MASLLTTNTPSSSSSSQSSASPLSPPACKLARQAPAAGFLHKLSSVASPAANINSSNSSPTTCLKKRFFILQPGTFLYYFLSDQDRSPRGCLDLEGSWLQEEPQLQQQQHADDNHDTTTDETFCFSVNWSETHKKEKVILQAPNESQGRAWMEALETSRFDYAKEQLQRQVTRNSALKSRVRELEQQVNGYKLMEQDRDFAVEDAALWKQKMEALDENIRRLSLRLRQQPVQSKRRLQADTQVSPSGMEDEKKT
jgi:hypothetical protein